MKKNECARLKITDMNSLGYGVGRLEGKAVFVPGGVTGDLMDIRIIKDGGSYLVARCDRVVTGSEKRCPSCCPSFPKCGGCAFCHISYEYEKELKEQFVRSFLCKAGLPDVKVLSLLSTGKTAGYRNKVQYPYRDAVMGYYASHTHRVVKNEGCALHHPKMEPVLRDLSEFLSFKKIEGYDEERGTGLLRHVYLRTNADGSQMLLTLVINGEYFPFSSELAAFLEEKHPEVTGIFLNVNTRKSNVILGDRYILLKGREYITDSLLSCTFEMSPASFYQVNREAAELLYREVIEKAEIGGGEKVADLFCGIGTIGLCLAKNSKIGELTGVEVVPQAVENARRNALRSGIENARFVCGDANHPALHTADLVIVDPPRKGLDRALIEQLSDMRCGRVVYVSCDPATFARDLKRFRELGWNIGEVRPVDMFPRTGHVETVCLLSKLNVKQHIEVELTMDEMDLTAAEKKAGYKDIKETRRHFGMIKEDTL